MTRFQRVRAGAGIGLAQLRHARLRTTLVVLAIALAVLSTTLLASIGAGVLETGSDRFTAAERDLWVSGGPTRLVPGQVGGIENGLVDAHTVSATIDAHEAVVSATPLAYGTVYVGTEPGDLEPIVGVGVSGGGPAFEVVAGRQHAPDSSHYANGTYTGPMSREIVIDPRTADRFGVGVGDSLYVGGTLVEARQSRFEVVGISPTFTRFLGTPVVTLPLAEFQTLTGMAGADRAAQITVRVRESASVETVQADLERQYPDYEVRSNEEQLRVVLGRQARVVASAAVLVVLAVVAGIALTVNSLALLVQQQRRAFAALKAAGVSSWTLGGAVLWQGVGLASLGAAVGLLATPLGVVGLNALVSELVGFSTLVRTPPWVYLLGAGLAVGIGVVGGVVAAWRVSRIPPLSR